MRLRACLTSGLPAYLAEAGWPHCCSARAFHGAHAPATRRPRHQNGCEAEPGTCWGMLRANHLVNRHEQGVRPWDSRAERQWSWRSARIRGGQKVAALVVRREYSTTPRSTGRVPSDVLGAIQGSTGVLGRYWALGYTIPFLLVPRMISVG